MGLQKFPDDADRRCDVLRQSVPQSGSSDRKSLIADGWKTGALDKKRWRRCRRRRWQASSADDWWVTQQGTEKLSGVGVWTASLNLMRSGTFSQCNCARSCVMRSYLDAENTSRVAEFNTDCTRFMCWCDALRYHSPIAAKGESKPVTVERS